jgi:hypothetical protein
MQGPIISATAKAIDLMASPGKFQVDAHTLTRNTGEFQNLPARRGEISNPISQCSLIPPLKGVPGREGAAAIFTSKLICQEDPKG